MMNGNRRQRLLEKYRDKKARLELYKQQEADMLSGADISNTIGSRRIERYPMSLKELRAAIKDLEDEISGLEEMIDGGSARRSFAVIPRDW